jgi:hypothetical protein
VDLPTTALAGNHTLDLVIPNVAQYFEIAAAVVFFR